MRYFSFGTITSSRRPLIGQLVRSILDVLDRTGKTEFCLRPAFLYQNRELGVDLDIKNNEWTGLLQDSYLMAAYTIVSEICLECRQPDHTISICGDESRYTVLQTHIAVKREGRGRIFSYDRLKRLKIASHNRTYKAVNGEERDSSAPQFMIPESSIKRIALLNHSLTIAEELLAPSSYSLSGVIRESEAA
jgi:hypothetical protein